MIAAVQLAGLLLAPLLPGAIQTAKARLQGRRGASPLQPYRELRRLWRKSVVDPEGTGPVYLLAPALVAACLVCAIALIPVGGRVAGWGLGDDALVLIGLLALARLAIALAAWDTGNGFTLMGAARDLMLSVFTEGLFLLVVLCAAFAAHSTSLAAIVAAGNGPEVWNQPAHWCGLFAFVLLLVAELGRQPVDNPDTHLELTMIHEGPLLEYAGRDLAFLQWAAAARHWVFLVAGAGLFLPHAGGAAEQLAWNAAAVVVLCALLAVVETVQAKMRILRVPGLLALGGVIAVVGIGAAAGGL